MRRYVVRGMLGVGYSNIGEGMVAIMRAHLGDQLVIESTTTDAARRDGEIVGLHHADGTPPYEVRWSDTDEVTLVFPGPDAHIHHVEHGTVSTHEPSRPVGVEEAGAVSGAAPLAGVPNPGDIGRRVAVERKRQGLTRAETARRAAMAPDYLAYLEEQPADPSPATLIRLAAALGTSVAALRGGGIDLPPGQGHALLHPQLRDLGPDECRARLSTHGVGRVAVSTPDGPAVIPVNYEVIDDAIAYRTAPDAVPAAAVGTEVAFEADHVDEAMSQGWSVLVVGPARAVTEPDAVRRLSERAHTEPWAGGEREMWVSIQPTRLTGRRISPADG
jgi:nitroimidazol reductase NimA-like FMN-containing flavoprotein (pyridoxamine 5'-phosphate oxidase superfamily)